MSYTPLLTILLVLVVGAAITLTVRPAEGAL